MLLGFVILALPAIAVLSLVAFVPYALHVKRRFGRQSFLYYLARYTMIGYCFSLIYLTILWMFPYITFFPEHYFLNLRPFVWLSEGYLMGAEKMAEQLVLNIGMFIPYGLLLPITMRKLRSAWKVLSVVLLTTVAIETLQYFTGRSADIDDVIMNFTGGVLGYLVYKILARILRNKLWWKNMLDKKKT